MRRCFGRWQEVRPFGVVENQLGCGAVEDELTVSVFDVMRDVTLSLILRASFQRRSSLVLVSRSSFPIASAFWTNHRRHCVLHIPYKPWSQRPHIVPFSSRTS
jgi:hypothetical protein